MNLTRRQVLIYGDQQYDVWPPEEKNLKGPSLARASSARAVLQSTFTHMSERYRFVEGHAHFITFAVVGWVDVFTRREYAEFLLQNLAYCRKNKGLRLYEFVIMPNHLHLIAAAPTASSA